MTRIYNNNQHYIQNTPADNYIHNIPSHHKNSKPAFFTHKWSDEEEFEQMTTSQKNKNTQLHIQKLRCSRLRADIRRRSLKTR